MLFITLPENLLILSQLLPCLRSFFLATFPILTLGNFCQELRAGVRGQVRKGKRAACPISAMMRGWELPVRQTE